MNSVVRDRIEPEVFPSFHVGTGSIEVFPLTATIGAELRDVSLAEA
jgi:taurine dioxygenase